MIRIEYCPLRFPFKLSKRLELNAVRSPSEVAASRIRKRFSAVGHFGDDFLNNFLDVLHLGDVSLARVKLGCDGEVPDFREAAAKITDMFVDSEDLLHDEHDRKRLSGCRHGPVGGHLKIAARDLDLSGG